MARLKGIGSFLGFAAGLFLALRALHVFIPMLEPTVLAGPFRLDRLDVDTTRTYLGFSPRIPFYRPQSLGVSPQRIEVYRRPYPTIAIVWEEARSLELRERRGGSMPSSPVGAPSLPGRPDSARWREGSKEHAVLRLDDLWIELATDLSREDVLRIVDTLRPIEQLR